MPQLAKVHFINVMCNTNLAITMIFILQHISFVERQASF